jgi:hypothetical protein
MKDAERESARAVWADAAKAVGLAFVKFTENLTVAWDAVTKAIREAFFPVDPAVALAQRRARFGGMGGDAGRWPDQWYSMHCTAWLCAECPSDVHGLRCQCPHHKKVRS